MTPFRALTLLIIALLLGACDRSWPPKKQELVDHFTEHQTEIEVLEARIRATDYWQVNSGGWERGSDEPPDWVGVIVDVEGGRERTRITGEQAVEWNLAFREASVYSVSQDDRGTLIDVLATFPRDTNGFAVYRRGPERTEEWVECGDDFRYVRCGACAVTLSDGWTLDVLWYQWPMDEQLFDDFLDQRMSEEDYRAKDDELTEACFAEGAEVIGFTYPAAGDDEMN